MIINKIKKLLTIVLCFIMGFSLISFSGCYIELDPVKSTADWNALHQTATGWGFEGSLDEFVTFLLGENGNRDDERFYGLNAFEIFLLHNSDFNGDKNDWIEWLVNGQNKSPECSEKPCVCPPPPLTPQDFSLTITVSSHTVYHFYWYVFNLTLGDYVRNYYELIRLYQGETLYITVEFKNLSGRRLEIIYGSSMIVPFIFFSIYNEVRLFDINFCVLEVDEIRVRNFSMGSNLEREQPEELKNFYYLFASALFRVVYHEDFANNSQNYKYERIRIQTFRPILIEVI